jgi:hypothetical protein
MPPTESKTNITAILGKLAAIILMLVAWNLLDASTTKPVNYDNLPRKSVNNAARDSVKRFNARQKIN